MIDTYDDFDDRAAEEKANAKALQRASREADEFRRVLSTADGRAVLWRLLASCGVASTSFRGEQPMLMAFLEGRRDVGTKLIAAIELADRNVYPQMRLEAIEREMRETAE